MEEQIYKQMYYRLFRAATDATALLQRMEIIGVVHTLMDAQRETEELYLDADRPEETAT